VTAIDPTPEQLSALAAAEDDGPVVMINLLQFAGADGAASYERYAEAVQPHLERVGATALSVGAVRQLVIGEGERPWWDAIIVVQYPSIAAFFAMVAHEGYQAIAYLRSDALARAELIATKPGAISV
jgi:uncharacterized protein (DUF1330 family)